MRNSDLTIDYVRRRLRYDSATGKLYWKPRPRSDFDTLHSWAVWTGRFEGKEAFATPDGDGYLRGGFDYGDYFAHRIIFFMHYGWWPKHIDHNNGCKSDNRLHNLVPSEAARNSKNAFKSRANTSGATGVTWDKRKGRWMSKISVNYKTIFLGYYDTVESASAARHAAELQHGFSDRHGESRA